MVTKKTLKNAQDCQGGGKKDLLTYMGGDPLVCGTEIMVADTSMLGLSLGEKIIFSSLFL